MKYLEMKKRAFMSIVNAAKPTLPFEFQQVEYIESTGTQYIDTGFTPNNKTRMLLDFQYTSLGVDRGRIAGTRYDSLSQGFYLGLYNGTYWYAAYNIGSFVGTHANTQRHIFDLNQDKAYLDDVLVMQFDPVEFTGYGNIYLFSWSAPIIDYNSYAKIYNCKIWDNNMLVRDFIPCYRKFDGVKGMFDLVNNKFYENAGTGTFLKGENI